MNEFLSQNSALIAITLWSLPWKGVALWKAAIRKEKRWFITLLLVNSIGILDILYIFIFSKREIKPIDIQKVSENNNEEISNKENSGN